jgi:hypothetical protein
MMTTMCDAGDSTPIVVVTVIYIRVKISLQPPQDYFVKIIVPAPVNSYDYRPGSDLPVILIPMYHCTGGSKSIAIFSQKLITRLNIGGFINLVYQRIDKINMSLVMHGSWLFQNSKKVIKRNVHFNPLLIIFPHFLWNQGLITFVTILTFSHQIGSRLFVYAHIVLV